MSATHPYVRYAVAKAVKKGEDCCLCLPTQQWPVGHTGGAAPRTYGLYAVIDGHNGPAAAEFTTARLPGLFSVELSRALKVYDGARDESVAAALGATFLGLDQQFCKQAQLSGCTCTVAVLVGWTLTVANIGDSRAILDTGATEVRVQHCLRGRTAARGATWDRGWLSNWVTPRGPYDSSTPPILGQTGVGTHPGLDAPLVGGTAPALQCRTAPLQPCGVPARPLSACTSLALPSLLPLTRPHPPGPVPHTTGAAADLRLPAGG
jgi:hypothetical protein